MKKQFFSEKEAAQLYPYTVHWFRRKRWDGTGPKFIKTSGSRVMYRLADLEDYFNQFDIVNSTSAYHKTSLEKEDC